MLNNLIATMIETWFGFFHDVFSNAIYDKDVYGISFWLVLLIPIIILFVFYKLIDIVGGNMWHFILFVLIALVIEYLSNVGLLFGVLSKYTQDEGFVAFVNEYSLYATIISLISTIIGTIGLRYLSTNNRYNPF